MGMTYGQLFMTLNPCVKVVENGNCIWIYFDSVNHDTFRAEWWNKKIPDEALQTQEPRVMTLEEVKQAKGRDVWLELSGIFAETALTAATIEGCGTKGICTRYESLKYTQYCVRPYGWRCWSARPTEQQRKGVTWNDSGRMGERF